AGKCTKTKQWIRPVLNDLGAEIPILQTRILNERNRTTWPLTVLQRIKITISHPSPLRHQPENYVIEEKEWTDHYKISFSEALTFLDTPSSLSLIHI
ncbi:dual OB domain-containing protein, partial [Acinetobacter baumannii]|uniref:dual OB domain-containing protein n=1 Tax=Acinetobacter baumannii TaxID=470 RepID=UPI00396F65C6